MPPEQYRDLDESKVDSRVMQSLREANKHGRFPVYLTGGVGCGKSYTAASVYARCTGTVAMYGYSEFISDAIQVEKSGGIQRYMGCGALIEMTDFGWWNWLSSVGLLIVDDIGTGMSHERRNELFVRLIDGRSNKPLVMTGNLDMNEVGDHFDARIASRIASGTVVDMGVNDLRMDGFKDRFVRIGDNH